MTEIESTQAPSTQETTGITPTEGMIQSLIPHYIEGDRKAQYLGYLIAGFSKHESVKLTGLHPKTLERWTNGDPDFVEFVSKIPEVRESLGNKLLDIEFTRNFKLILSKDFKVLYKDAVKVPLTLAEEEYLMTIRKFYTPQHLIYLRQLLAGGDKAEEAFDYTKAVLEIRLSKETISGKIPKADR